MTDNVLIILALLYKAVSRLCFSVALSKQLNAVLYLGGVYSIHVYPVPTITGRVCPTCTLVNLALLPGLPTIQILIACSYTK